MTKRPRRRFSPECKEQVAARLAEPGVTRAELARGLGVTAAQLKEWRTQLAAAGSAAAVTARQAEAE